jgi:hypothetical protein
MQTQRLQDDITGVPLFFKNGEVAENEMFELPW